jgi:hypothetical protein
VYSTCLYCTRELGRNDVLELLPIGRRVAFDADKGRLWVVCRRCEKWNLVPFETRLETIDVCERIFAATGIRYSTDHIGMARTAEGLELVRIGAAQRPEFAAWRYGDQFGRRRRTNAFKVAGLVGASAVVLLAHGTMLQITGISGSMGLNVFSWGHGIYYRRRVAVRLPEREGLSGVLTARTLNLVEVVTAPDGSFGLRLPVHKKTAGGFAIGLRGQRVQVWGAHAVETLGKVLPHVNRTGGSRKRVADAVELIEQERDVHGVMAAHLRQSTETGPEPLTSLNVRVRLALEMAAHEDTERIALNGELKLLERQWRDADALAKVADGLELES